MTTLAVIGLGYVGLPLVVEFGKQMRTIGFDIAEHKVAACLRGTDPSRELTDDEMAQARHAIYTADPKLLGEADIIIVAVKKRSGHMEFNPSASSVLCEGDKLIAIGERGQLGRLEEMARPRGPGA